jgi:hypothetical protein
LVVVVVTKPIEEKERKRKRGGLSRVVDSYGSSRFLFWRTLGVGGWRSG